MVKPIDEQPTANSQQPTSDTQDQARQNMIRQILGNPADEQWAQRLGDTARIDKQRY